MYFSCFYLDWLPGRGNTTGFYSRRYLIRCYCSWRQLRKTDLQVCGFSLVLLCYKSGTMYRIYIEVSLCTMHPPTFFLTIVVLTPKRSAPLYLRCARTCTYIVYMLNITPGSHKNDLLAYSLCISTNKAETRIALAISVPYYINSLKLRLYIRLSGLTLKCVACNNLEFFFNTRLCLCKRINTSWNYNTKNWWNILAFCELIIRKMLKESLHFKYIYTYTSESFANSPLIHLDVGDWFLWL